METTSIEFSRYKNLFKAELIDDILPYWIKHSVDQNGEGFYGAVDIDGEPILTANISCVLVARILWIFSVAAIEYINPECSRMADRAYLFLQKYFDDRQYGGYYMELKPDNTVATALKHTYAQAFVIYALCNITCDSGRKSKNYVRSSKSFHVDI